MVNKLSIMENPGYFHRATYKRLAAHNRLVPLTTLKRLNSLGPEKRSDLDAICEIDLICDTAFTDSDVELVLRNHAPLKAKAYSTYRYDGKDQSVLSVKFY